MHREEVLHLNGKEYPICSMTLNLRPLNLLSWLKDQKSYPKCYWRSRDEQKEIAALGAVFALNEIPHFETLCKQPMRFFGGCSFSEFQRDTPDEKKNLWEDFPKKYFFLPRYEIHQEGEDCHMMIRFFPSQKKCSDISLKVPSSSYCRKKMRERCDLPHYAKWESHLEKCLEHFRDKFMSKIVLARCSTFTFEEYIDPWELLNTLKPETKRATLFAFQIQPTSVFLGATPEKLYLREKRQIYSEALAGTKPCGLSKNEDKQFQKELLESDKEKREFLKVKTFIQRKLMPFCEQLDVEKQTRVLLTANVQHLHHLFSGTLKENVTDRDLISALHPTPAIGGTPRSAALKYIDSYEPFYRGWYAGPIGWIEAEKAEIAIGIRSALVQKENVHLFAGTGIVEGSLPIKEWEELEHKISQFLKVL